MGAGMGARGFVDESVDFVVSPEHPSRRRAGRSRVRGDAARACLWLPPRRTGIDRHGGDPAGKRGPGREQAMPKPRRARA
ncbi:hypothetical protein G432_16850 [Sphingomonas sp. MM-1]|nr:hypothetical protein G432_16850 [Sphingomonas sp. MM-1]